MLYRLSCVKCKLRDRQCASAVPFHVRASGPIDSFWAAQTMEHLTAAEAVARTLLRWSPCQAQLEPRSPEPGSRPQETRSLLDGNAMEKRSYMQRWKLG